MSGEGTATAGTETAPIRAGDALAIRLNESQSFTAGGTDLELLIVGVSRNMDTKAGLTMTSGRRSGRGLVD
jgi:mannose-6-phosphate isomerase-like protein (cupin superfamily)